MESQRQRNARLAAKWGGYTLLLVLAAVLQTMPGLFTVGGVKPLFILPLCMAVALHEDEYAGALFGAAGGLLWDFTAGRTAGMLALGLMCLCFVGAVVERMYLQQKLSNYVVLTLAVAFLTLNSDFLFFYIMRNYPGAWQHYLTVSMPILVFTGVTSPVSFYLVRWIWRRWGSV